MYVRRDYANPDAGGTRKFVPTADSQYVVHELRPTAEVLRIGDDLDVVALDRIAPAEEPFRPASSRTTPPHSGRSSDVSEGGNPRSRHLVAPVPNEREAANVKPSASSEQKNWTQAEDDPGTDSMPDHNPLALQWKAEGTRSVHDRPKATWPRATTARVLGV